MEEKSFFPQSSMETLKLEFFDHLIETDESVYIQFQQFLAYYAAGLDVVMDEVDQFFKSQKQAIIRELEAVDFNDIDYDEYAELRDYYVPAYDIVSELVEEKLNNVLGGFIGKSFEYLSSHHYDKAVISMVAFYEGSLVANIECDTTELEIEVDYTFTESLKKRCTALEKVIVPDNQAHTILKILLERINIAVAHKDDLIKFIQPILDVIICNQSIASAFIQNYESLKLSPPLLARNFATSIKLVHGMAAWKNTALDWYKTDKFLASDLLQYFLEDDINSYILMAESLWEGNLFKSDFAQQFNQYIKFKQSPELYKQVRLYLTYNRQDAAYYREVVQHLTIHERYAFVERCRHDDKLYITLLSVDSRYDDALRFLEENVDIIRIADLVKRISNDRPHECFVLVRNKIRQTLQTARNRDTYSQIVETIKVINSLPGYSEQTQSLINELYARKPALPSLKSELKSAGFVPK